MDKALGKNSEDAADLLREPFLWPLATQEALETVLLDSALSGDRIAVLGRRGWGKTTVLERVCRLLTDMRAMGKAGDYPVVVYVDCAWLSDDADLNSRLAAGLLESFGIVPAFSDVFLSSPAAAAYVSLAAPSSIIRRFTSPASVFNSEASARILFEGLPRHLDASKERVVFVLDEFQKFTDDYEIKRLAKLMDARKDIGCVVAGSGRKELFDMIRTGPLAPLDFRSFSLLAIPDGDFHLAALSRPLQIKADPGIVHDFATIARGRPVAVRRLVECLGRLSSSDSALSPDDPEAHAKLIRAAVDLFVRDESSRLETVWNGLSTAERTVAWHMAGLAIKNPYGMDFLGATEMLPAAMRRTLLSLEASEMLENAPDGRRLADPILDLWISDQKEALYDSVERIRAMDPRENVQPSRIERKKRLGGRRNGFPPIRRKEKE